jgi:hypothetical protein
MAKVVKVIELMSQSPESWEDAAQGAVKEATKPCETSARFTSRNLPPKWTAEKSPTIASTQKSHLIWSADQSDYRQLARDTLIVKR